MFLVAITSLRRVSELQALTTAEPYMQIHKDKVALRTNPHFLPKVATSFHVNQTIYLPAFFQHPKDNAERMLHTLDVRRALIYYLSQTNGIRKGNQLFVAFAGATKGSPVTKATIARWIARTIELCYSKAGKELVERPKAHSTRKKGATIAFQANLPLSDICLAATWSSTHTFMKHYCVDFHFNKEAQVGQKVLGHLFASTTSQPNRPSASETATKSMHSM